SGSAQERSKTRDFDLVEPLRRAILALALGGDESAEQVVPWFRTAFLHEFVVEHPGLDVDLHRPFADPDLTDFTRERLADPTPDLLRVLLGPPEHGGDHFYGERGGEVLDRVEPVRIDAVEILLHLRVDPFLLRLDCARSEHLVEQAAHAPV